MRAIEGSRGAVRLAVMAGLLLIAGCQTNDVELPRRVGGGTDELKRSPCACLALPLDHSPAGAAATLADLMGRAG